MAMRECKVCFASVDEKAVSCPCCGSSMKRSESETNRANRNAVNGEVNDQSAKKSNYSAIYAEQNQRNYSNIRKVAPPNRYIGSFLLGFFLGELGLLISIFSSENIKPVKKAGLGALISIVFIAAIIVLL